MQPVMIGNIAVADAWSLKPVRTTRRSRLMEVMNDAAKGVPEIRNNSN
jgi:hypothetical protein